MACDAHSFVDARRASASPEMIKADQRLCLFLFRAFFR
jgi:hypothetical protein